MGNELVRLVASAFHRCLDYCGWILCGFAVQGVATWLLWILKKKMKGINMLEGKEVDIALGSVGHASIDLDDKGNVEVAVSAKIDLFAFCQEQAKKTNTTLDDAFVATLMKLVGRA